MIEFGNPLSLLAIEEKPNSFLPIDINSLGLAFPCKNLTLRDIDYLVVTYGIDGIKEAIKNANIVSDDSLIGNLVILYEDNEQRRKAPLISKQTFESYSLANILTEYITDKDFINQVITKIKSLKIQEELVSSIEEKLKTANVYLALEALNLIGYINSRKLYLQMIKIVERKKNATRVREIDLYEMG